MDQHSLAKSKGGVATLGADPGIEPGLSDNETDVLPLDESAIWMRELALP